MRRVPSRPGGNDTQKNSCPDGAGAGPPGHAGDPGAGLAVPATWRALLEELAPAFRPRPTPALFMALACGVILASRGPGGALAAAFPGRIIHGVGDAAFHGQALICPSTTWTTRLPANAALYGPRPAPTGKRGRPRKKGHRLGTPPEIARKRDTSWQAVTVRI